MLLEEGAKEIISMGFVQRTKTNAKEIWYGLKIRPLYRCIIFFFIFSGVIPSYSDYFYYYLTDVLEFNDFQYSILNVVSTFTLIIAVYFYNLWFKDIESAWMLIACCVINIIGSINSMSLVLGFTFGMSPDAFVFLSNTVTDTLNNCIQLLSGNVLFAKLIPANIESSMFAILTGIINLCHFFVAKQLGNFFNLFVGVNDENLEDLWVLFLITAVCSIIPIFFIWLVPRRKEVFLVQ